MPERRASTPEETRIGWILYYTLCAATAVIGAWIASGCPTLAR